MKRLGLLLRTVICLHITMNFVYSQEICDNGIDDDGDGLIDLNDIDDCNCNVFYINSTIIPNPSFEIFSCCPSNFTQLSCVNNWAQATPTATSDYFNTCGFTAGTTPFPLPNGDGYAGVIILSNYKEYIGTCLNTPMIAGIEYTLFLNIAAHATDSYLEECTNTMILDPLDITLFGHQSCPNFPIPIGNGDCPANFGWSALGSTAYSPSGNWTTISIVFTPTHDINSIILGGPCVLPSSYPIIQNTPCTPYFYLDNLSLYDNKEPFDVSISQNGSYCENTLTLQSSSLYSSGSWQWYYNGIALVGETSNLLSISSNTNQSGIYTAQQVLGGVTCGTESFNIIIPCPLPTELTEFDVICNDEEIKFNWTTASEYGSDFFDIQFSKTGVNFESIARIDGAGNSSTINKYNHKIVNNEYLVGYFKLKQMDYNGDFQFSKTVFSECSVDNLIVSLIDGKLVIKNYKEIYNCIVYDYTGKMLFNSPNFESFEFNKSNSFYFIQIESDNGWSTHKLF